MAEGRKANLGGGGNAEAPAGKEKRRLGGA